MNRISIPEKYHGLLAHIVVLVMIAMPVFAHLDSIPFETYDENRLALNATEMTRSGNYFATTYKGQPEFWNTKPPLFTWIQVLFLHIFGYTELSYRLPAAIAAALCCLLLLRFLKRRTGSWLPGIIAAGILVTSRGFVGPHASRTGDYDTLLTLCLCASLFWLADYVEEGKQRLIYYSGAALTAAVLTKGIAGFFFCPGMILYVLIRKKGLVLLRTRAFWISLAGLVVLVSSYYIIRESQQPGYFQAVLSNEVGGRYTTAIEGHSGDTWTYYNTLRDESFTPWFYLLIPAALAALVVKDKRQANIALLCALTAGILFLILSNASTQAFWYLVPLYPLLSVFCALVVWQVCELLLQCRPATGIWKVNLLPIFLLLLIGTAPYQSALDQALHGRGTQSELDAKLYIKEGIAGQRKMMADTYCGWDYPVLWYLDVAAQKGMPIRMAEKDSLAQGMRVLVWEGDRKDYIRQHYLVTKIDSAGLVDVLAINGSWHAADTANADSLHNRANEIGR